MSQSNALRVSVTDLRRPGATRDVDLSATLADLQRADDGDAAAGRVLADRVRATAAVCARSG